MIRKVWQNVALVLLVAMSCFLLFVFGYYRVCVIGSTDRAPFEGLSGAFYAIQKLNIKVLLLACIGVSSFLVFIINRLLKYMGEIMYLNSPLSKIDRMSGEEFENYLKLRFRKLGYKVEITPVTGDYGADLFCFNKNETIVVQAKRYEGNVGTSAVQEVVGAREYYEADSCIVVTNSHFTINALNLAEANGVVLIDRDDLLNFDFERIHRTV